MNATISHRAFHANGERCHVATTTHDCPRNHEYVRVMRERGETAVYVTYLDSLALAGVVEGDCYAYTHAGTVFHVPAKR